MTKEGLLKEIENTKNERLKIFKGKYASPTDMLKLVAVSDKKLERLGEELKKLAAV